MLLPFHCSLCLLTLYIAWCFSLSHSSSFGFCFRLENFWLRDSCELIYVLGSGWFVGNLGNVGIGRICHDYLLGCTNWTLRRSAGEMHELSNVQLEKPMDYWRSAGKMYGVRYAQLEKVDLVPLSLRNVRI